LRKVQMAFGRRQFEADLSEEVRLHRDLAGTSAFGSEALFLEQSREVWGVGWFDALLRDVRFALRSFRKTPVFALAVVGTIGAALGMNTTMFTVFSTYVLRPYPVRDPQQLYFLTWIGKGNVGHRF